LYVVIESSFLRLSEWRFHTGKSNDRASSSRVRKSTQARDFVGSSNTTGSPGGVRICVQGVRAATEPSRIVHYTVRCRSHSADPEPRHASELHRAMPVDPRIAAGVAISAEQKDLEGKRLNAVTGSLAA
jgi:hypothetical protein